MKTVYRQVAYRRPTIMAAAFIDAAVKSGDLTAKTDSNHWVARRVALNATDRNVGERPVYDRVTVK